MRGHVWLCAAKKTPHKFPPKLPVAAASGFIFQTGQDDLLVVVNLGPG